MKFATFDFLIGLLIAAVWLLAERVLKETVGPRTHLAFLLISIVACWGVILWGAR